MPAGRPVPRLSLLGARARAGLVLLALSGAPAVALGQVTTGGIRGSVTSDNGTPIAGAEVTLVHEPTGSTDRSLTNASGGFVFSGKAVGGPYKLTVGAATYETFESSRFSVNLGRFLDVQVVLRSAVEEITVVGSTAVRQLTGRAVFEADKIAELPTVARDPKDFVRLMPEAYTDAANLSAISIGGNNSRYNSITIDGIRQDDDFGLNNQGYPTQRSPISLSAIQEIAVEQSPFDVRYSRFLGGNVNIVTKSGTNDYHGSVFFNFTDDHLAGDKSRARDIRLDFREMQYGVAVSGPILVDKLHFFANYEGFGGLTPFSFGPRDSGATNEVPEVTLADVSEAQRIAREAYDFDAGNAGRPLEQDDHKVLAKLDWAATEAHRLTASFQRSAGNRIREFSPSRGALYLTSVWYDKTETMNVGSLRLNSNWSPELNTAFEVSAKTVDTRQEPLIDRDFMEARITTAGGGQVRLGPDEYRHANKLDNTLYQAKASADYLLGVHLLTGGFEFERLGIYNLFVPASNGVATYGSLSAFERKRPSQIRYQNAVTNDAKDGAVNWWYGIASAYLQDELQIAEGLDAQLGVRFETYYADDGIKENSLFRERYGFSNSDTIGGRKVIMPRAGVTYSPLDGFNVRAGLGLYSGGTPTVWVSNNYSNDGVTIDTATDSRPRATPGNPDPDDAVLDGFDGRNVPLALQSELRPLEGNVNALDPDFKIPSTWKASVGADYAFALPILGEGFAFNWTYTYSRVRHAVLWKDLRRDLGLPFFPDNQPVGVLPDGRPYYDNGQASPNPNYNVNRGSDLLLTNTTKGSGHVISTGLRRAFDFGLSLYAGYAFQDVKDVNPATSSVAQSNYAQLAVRDPNNPELATSNYERRHRLLGVIEFTRPLLLDLLSSASLVIEARSGQPYSLTYGGTSSADNDTLARTFGETSSIAGSNRMLLYVPKGDGSDVSFQSAEDEESFRTLVRRHGLDKYRGQIVPRNAFRGPWIHRFDLRLMQQIPTPWSATHKARFVVDLQNVGNLVNKNWGRYEQVAFPYVAPVAMARVDVATGRYVYSNVRSSVTKTIEPLTSVWRIQAGLVYEL